MVGFNEGLASRSDFFGSSSIRSQFLFQVLVFLDFTIQIRRILRNRNEQLCRNVFSPTTKGEDTCKRIISALI